MTRFFPAILLACLLGPTAILAVAREADAPAASDLVITSGLKDGGYWNVGNRLRAAAEGMGLSAENHPSTGSLTNLKLLADESVPVNLAFAQADALHYFLDRQPEARGAIEILESIGEECVFVISGKKSGIRNDQDMQDAVRLQLGIKSPNSGIRVTFDHMASLVPELGDVTVHYGDTVELINELVHRLSDIEKAVMVVQRPEARSPEIDMVVSNPDKYRFVKITDERFTLPGPGGEAAYRRDRVTPSAVPGAGAVETICVRGLLVTNTNKLSAEQRSGLEKLIGDHWAEVRAD